MGLLDAGWFWFGNQGLSYLEIGRFWQIAFFAALAMWSWLVCRAFWPSRSLWWDAARHFWTGRIRLEHLLWAATINIAVLYVFGMIPLTGVESSFTITDYWRWWVVHLWVEQSFEFYAAAMSASLLMGLDLVSRNLAERAVYFEIILVFLGGVLGTGHHLYWVGGPNLWIPFGTMFSFIEVLPLVLLILKSIEQRRLIKAHQEFKYGLPYTYIVGAAFWNFVGAGVFGGGTLNAPLVNYYEHGTFPDFKSCAHRLVWRLWPARDRLDLLLPTLRGGGSPCLQGRSGIHRFLALQWRPRALDYAELLPNRLGATERGL